MKVIIAGTRTITDQKLVYQAITNSGFGITEVVCGTPWDGADDYINAIPEKDPVGVDQIGHKWALEHDVPVKIMEPEWNNLESPGAIIRFRNGDKRQKYNAKAGPDRNQRMAEYGEALILVWDGKSSGSADMRRRALARNLPYWEVKVRSNG